VLRRGRILVLLLLGIAIPATAQTFGFSIGGPAPCLPIGNTAYRLVASDKSADYTVRMDSAAASPDIRVRLSDTPDEADFVLVDDGEAAPGCSSQPQSAIRTVRIDAVPAPDDFVVSLAAAPAPADYRIYLRTREVAPMAAAALVAAAELVARKHAGRSNPSN
jgi:hypothetical protein